MRLADFDPQWIDHGDRKGIGVSFRCLTGHCTGRLWIMFANPLDGGPAYEGNCFALMLQKQETGEPGITAGSRPCGPCRWKRIGDTFETLTMTPSVDAHQCGHKTLTNGVFQ